MNSIGLWCCAEPDLNLPLSNEFKASKVKNFVHQFALTDESINYLKILFDNEIAEGLNTDKTSNPANVSKMAMDVTYFTELFDGTEKGEFVVINLTAQNLILVLATIEPGFPVKTVRKYFTIDENVRSSPYIKIFEYLCDCLLIFFTENDLLNKLQTLGFSTDLPMIQFDIDKAIINYFTTTASDIPLNFYDIRKCFEIVLLKERYKDIQFNLVAILNNNMSLLIYYSYLYGSIDIFINLEDDCDLIYQEKIANVKKWKSVYSGRTQVYIDTGLRNFGRTGTLNFMTTDLDWSVISKSLSCIYADTECRLEKFMAEKYILELIRHILTTLHHELLYCREGDIGDLYKVNGVSLTDVINLTKAKDLNHASQLLPAGTIGMSKDDVLIAKYVCSIVLIRSALLLSICLSQILKKIEKDDFVIVIKSPLLEEHPNYETYIRNYMEILAPKKKFQIINLKDNGSVEGAALATSIISRQRKETS